MVVVWAGNTEGFASRLLVLALVHRCFSAELYLLILVVDHYISKNKIRPSGKKVSKPDYGIDIRDCIGKEVSKNDESN